MRRTWTKVAAAGLVVASGLGAGLPASGAPSPTEEHCALVIIGKAADGELRTAPMTCGPTPAAARDRLPAAARAVADWPIGVHYDGAGFTGASVTVWGADCTGGWLNLPGSWNDRVSSTLHGCPRIRHFLHVNLTGTTHTTYSPGGNLGTALNNEVSSIQYLP